MFNDVACMNGATTNSMFVQDHDVKQESLTEPSLRVVPNLPRRARGVNDSIPALPRRLPPNGRAFRPSKNSCGSIPGLNLPILAGSGSMNELHRLVSRPPNSAMPSFHDSSVRLCAAINCTYVLPMEYPHLRCRACRSANIPRRPELESILTPAQLMSRDRRAAGLLKALPMVLGPTPTAPPPLPTRAGPVLLPPASWPNPPTLEDTPSTSSPRVKTEPDVDADMALQALYEPSSSVDAIDVDAMDADDLSYPDDLAYPDLDPSSAPCAPPDPPPLPSKPASKRRKLSHPPPIEEAVSASPPILPVPPLPSKPTPTQTAPATPSSSKSKGCSEDGCSTLLPIDAAATRCMSCISKAWKMRNAKHRFPTPESPRKGKGVSWADKEDEFDEFKLDRAMSRSGSPHMSSSEDDEPPTPATTPGDHESRCDVPGWDSDLTDISSLSDEEEAASGGEESDGSGDSSEDDIPLAKGAAAHRQPVITGFKIRLPPRPTTTKIESPSSPIAMASIPPPSSSPPPSSPPPLPSRSPSKRTVTSSRPLLTSTPLKLTSSGTAPPPLPKRGDLKKPSFAVPDAIAAATSISAPAIPSSPPPTTKSNTDSSASEPASAPGPPSTSPSPSSPPLSQVEEQNHLKRCANAACQLTLAPDYPWKTCVVCRAGARDYQRQRLGLQGRHKRLDVELEQHRLEEEEQKAAVAASGRGESDFSSPPPPLPSRNGQVLRKAKPIKIAMELFDDDDRTYNLAPGARSCSIRDCSHIIPPWEEYPWKSCMKCRARSKDNHKAAKKKRRLTNSTGVPHPAQYRHEVAGPEAIAMKRADGRCLSMDCGMLISPESKYPYCRQCRLQDHRLKRRNLRKEQLELATTHSPSCPSPSSSSLLIKIPSLRVRLLRRRQLSSFPKVPPRPTPPYPEYKNLPALLHNFARLATSFFSAQTMHFAHQPPGTKPPLSIFIFDGEFSCVTTPYHQTLPPPNSYHINNKNNQYNFKHIPRTTTINTPNPAMGAGDASLDLRSSGNVIAGDPERMARVEERVAVIKEAVGRAAGVRFSGRRWVNLVEKGVVVRFVCEREPGVMEVPVVREGGEQSVDGIGEAMGEATVEKGVKGQEDAMKEDEGKVDGKKEDGKAVDEKKEDERGVDEKRDNEKGVTGKPEDKKGVDGQNDDGKGVPMRKVFSYHRVMEGELEVAVFVDRSHPFIPGERTVVRMRLVG